MVKITLSWGKHSPAPSDVAGTTQQWPKPDPAQPAGDPRQSQHPVNIQLRLPSVDNNHDPTYMQVNKNTYEKISNKTVIILLFTITITILTDPLLIVVMLSACRGEHVTLPSPPHHTHTHTHKTPSWNKQQQTNTHPRPEKCSKRNFCDEIMSSPRWATHCGIRVRKSCDCASEISPCCLLVRDRCGTLCTWTI